MQHHEEVIVPHQSVAALEALGWTAGDKATESGVRMWRRAPFWKMQAESAYFVANHDAVMQRAVDRWIDFKKGSRAGLLDMTDAIRFVLEEDFAAHRQVWP